MPLQIVRNDITKMNVDAIVSAADPTLLGDGGVSGAIFRAAGPALAAACRALHGCAEGEARITAGCGLPCRYVIHTVGPRWHGGQHGEQDRLVSCYRAALALAEEYGCTSVAFPLIASGNYGYPKDQALTTAVDTIRDFLLEHDMTVYLVIFGREAYRIGSRLFADITAYIDDRYAAAQIDRRRSCLLQPRVPMPERAPECKPAPDMAADTALLANALDQLDESFSEMLLRKIDERGMTDAQCYKKANIDRKLFSKIRSDKNYRPSKPTVIAFALALELPLAEMRDMLAKAGFALSHASKFDIIVEFFVERGNYNVFEINEALFAFDQPLLGM